MLGRVEQKAPLVYNDQSPAKASIARGLRISIDLEGSDPAQGGEIIGFRAKKNTPAVDLAKVNHYPAKDFWEPIYGAPGQRLILNPDDFYILVRRKGFRFRPNMPPKWLPTIPRWASFASTMRGFLTRASATARQATSAGHTPFSKCARMRCLSFSSTPKSWDASSTNA